MISAKIVIILLFKEVQEKISKATFKYFCYAVAIISMVLAFVHTTQSYNADEEIRPVLGSMLLVMLAVSIIGAWSMLFSPHQPIAPTNVNTDNDEASTNG